MGSHSSNRLLGLSVGEEPREGQFLLEVVGEQQASRVTHPTATMASGMETTLLIPEKKCRRNIPSDHSAHSLGPGHLEAGPVLSPCP